jgi:hypothetical protein
MISKVGKRYFGAGTFPCSIALDHADVLALLGMTAAMKTGRLQAGDNARKRLPKLEMRLLG